MSDTTGESAPQDQRSAGDLQSVVRSMKALAASSIGQYEKSVLRAGRLLSHRGTGPGRLLRGSGTAAVGRQSGKDQPMRGAIGAIVFGSDQGLVGQFNDVLADFVDQDARPLCPAKRKSGPSASAFMRGWRMPVCRRWDSSPCRLPSTPSRRSSGRFSSKVKRIAARARSRSFTSSTTAPSPGRSMNPSVNACCPWMQQWGLRLAQLPWPTKNLPEVIGGRERTLRALVREYLFVSLFRACAESLASENASRLAAMQRAEKNIDELLENLNRRSTACARAASTRNCSTSSPASRRWSEPMGGHRRKDEDENQFKGFSRAGRRRGRPPKVADERGARVQVEEALSKAPGRARRAA